MSHNGNSSSAWDLSKKANDKDSPKKDLLDEDDDCAISVSVNLNSNTITVDGGPSASDVSFSNLTSVGGALDLRSSSFSSCDIFDCSSMQSLDSGVANKPGKDYVCDLSFSRENSSDAGLILRGSAMSRLDSIDAVDIGKSGTNVPHKSKETDHESEPATSRASTEDAIQSLESQLDKLSESGKTGVSKMSSMQENVVTNVEKQVDRMEQKDESKLVGNQNLKDFADNIKQEVGNLEFFSSLKLKSSVGGAVLETSKEVTVESDQNLEESNEAKKTIQASSILNDNDVETPEMKVDPIAMNAEVPVDKSNKISIRVGRTKEGSYISVMEKPRNVHMEASNSLEDSNDSAMEKPGKIDIRASDSFNDSNDVDIERPGRITIRASQSLDSSNDASNVEYIVSTNFDDSVDSELRSSKGECFSGQMCDDSLDSRRKIYKEDDSNLGIEDSNDIIIRPVDKPLRGASQFGNFLKCNALTRVADEDCISVSDSSRDSAAVSMTSLNVVNEDENSKMSVRCKNVSFATCEDESRDESSFRVGEEESRDISDFHITMKEESQDNSSFQVTLEEESQDDLSFQVPMKEESQDNSSFQVSMEVDEMSIGSVTVESAPQTPSNARNKRKAKSSAPKKEPSDSPKIKKKKKSSLPLVTEHHKHKDAANILEYRWPPHEKSADWYLIQEHVSEYLGVVSFKRKYPDISRRPVDFQERQYLSEQGMVTEMQCDLGLTAVKAEDVYDLMVKDYPEKFKEYTKIPHRGEQPKNADIQKTTDGATGDKTVRLENLAKKAIKRASEYNSFLMRERRQERRTYFDLQTFEVHHPRQVKPAKFATAKLCNSYPVALLPGQFQEYYKSYSAQELRYFPVNTALYSPHKALTSIYADPTSGQAADESDAEDDDAKSTTSGMSSDAGDDEVSEAQAPDQNDSQKDDKKVNETPLVPDALAALKEESKENMTKCFVDISEAMISPASVKKVKRMSAKRKGPEPLTKCGMCAQTDKNKLGVVEELVRCSQCSISSHPGCLELSQEMIPIINTYPWQCMECKTCVKCMEPHDEDKMMFCDHCDRGYHTFCVGLTSIPAGRWECLTCLEAPENSLTPVAPPKPKPKRGRPFKYPRPDQPQFAAPPPASTFVSPTKT